jgi:hypothetical protein
METRNTNWYVARRGELLAEQFLLALQPDNVSASRSENVPFDFIAFFTKPDQTLFIIGVEVKATQQEIGGRYPFPAKQAMSLLHSNIPVLVVVIDVKTNEVYFNWIKDAIPAEKQAGLSDLQSCTLRLRKSSEEEMQRLRNEIMADVALTAAA